MRVQRYRCLIFAQRFNLFSKNKNMQLNTFTKFYLLIFFYWLCVTIGIAQNAHQTPSANQIRLFPNPATEFVILYDETNNVEQLIFLNIVGKQVKQFKVSEGMRYQLGDLPDGIYLVRILSHQGNLIKTIRISKLKIKA
jgi:hypothetical protein